MRDILEQISLSEDTHLAEEVCDILRRLRCGAAEAKLNQGATAHGLPLWSSGGGTPGSAEEEPQEEAGKPPTG